jgi:hypothetical protein
MIELLTTILVIITGIYAFFTFRILKANERVVSEMRQQREDLTRPYINIRSFFVPGMPVLGLSISNIGKSSANNLRLEIDRDFHQFADIKNNCNLKDFNAFREPIECFPPGAELIFYLAQGFVLFAENADQKITPHIFNVQASYSYSNKKVTESTTIDLRPYLNATICTEPVVSELKKLREEIAKVKGALEKRT